MGSHLAYPLIDIHTHLMPERLMQAVRSYFKANLWFPRYHGSTEELVPQLVEAGVDWFVFMPYAHRGGMAQSLNYWIANVQATYGPRAIGFGTFHPDDPGIASLVDEAFGHLALRGAKLHPQVGRFSLDDQRLYPLYERASHDRRVLLVHAGTRPEPNEFVGAATLRRVLRRFPRLMLVVAHMGADEFGAFYDLCGEYPNLYLDTAMVFNKYLGGPPPFEGLLEFQDRIVFGSDFPNIPYRVETAVQAIKDLRLGHTIEQKIFCTNAARLLEVDVFADQPPPG